ncbi:Ankyrin repeat-containing protein [Glarea lozoyensis ATCC 20868]|uniref:Ankyrin repeat-containing protein n=1 Tax=Glarea lozoyensis (strain ATCC 20868 / MF5171) TaxID=1116229 RepID=S3CQT6_GLAL2|nr:Ankyrin repeat-containing protein [Glarea lozoyensis ATCC 20868]EPE28782.1 Ankyrin repeat-containing protein [Glarea lozoyensis ATCC 20868]
MAESHAEQEKKPFGIVLTEESTTADLGPDFICSSYRTSRQLWEVLVGKDIAGPMIEACASGDNSTLKILLAQPQWSKIMLEKQHFICDQDRERKDENDVRGVSGMAAQNLVRAIIIAAKNGHDTVVRTLLDFVSQQGIKFESVLWRDALMYTIKNGHVAVFDAMASAWPGIVNSDLLCHRRRPLYEALREDQAEIVAEMLRLGADVTPSADWGPKPLSFNCSLLSVAARSRKGTRLTEVLLEHGVPIKGSGALHTAAYYGRIDIMRLLIQYGADVDEKLQKDTISHHRSALCASWTPAFFAASEYKLDAYNLLVENGASTTTKDANGMTPIQLVDLFEKSYREYSAAHPDIKNPLIWQFGGPNFSIFDYC